MIHYRFPVRQLEYPALGKSYAVLMVRIHAFSPPKLYGWYGIHLRFSWDSKTKGLPHSFYCCLYPCRHIAKIFHVCEYLLFFFYSPSIHFFAKSVAMFTDFLLCNRVPTADSWPELLAMWRQKRRMVSRSHEANQWIQVALGSYTKLTGKATQGWNEVDQWVIQYLLQYSDDGVNFYYNKELDNYKAKGQSSPK